MQLDRYQRIVITGGAGFIGSAVVRRLLAATTATVIVIDKLSYAGNEATLADVAHHPRFVFERIDICDAAALAATFERHRPDAVLHLAAETHVDRSIGTPEPFIATNIEGTFRLLEAALAHWRTADPALKERFRLVHVSTDEVYGSLGPEGRFDEASALRPNSPYAASKAAADHLVRAWHRTFELPVLTTHCSNNFGPYQYPEKLIPVLIAKALTGAPLPIYGSGENVRDWLYVDDHVEALMRVLDAGRIGETYAIAADNERRNLDLARAVCDCLDALLPGSPYRPHADLIRFVHDRPGHDLRYALDAGKIRGELGWTPRHDFAQALRATVAWYLDHQAWCAAVAARASHCAVGDDATVAAANPLWQPRAGGGERMGG